MSAPKAKAGIGLIAAIYWSGMAIVYLGDLVVSDLDRRLSRSDSR